MPEQTTTGLLTRIKAGDQSAASELFQRFANRLVGLARQRIDSDLRGKVDPEDVVQSVFRSFFRRNEAGEFNVEDSNDLWSLLAVITVHKCGHQIRYYRAARRAAGKEQGGVQYTDDSHASWEALAHDPTPSNVAMLNETLESMLNSLEGRERQMLSLALQGLSIEAISEDVGRSERTVRRVLERIRLDWESQATRR
jgi:RNA polymerase sigma-70 factor (ECF subfamily)